MNRHFTSTTRTFTKAALAVALFSTQLFSQSICDAVTGNIVKNCGFETGTLSSWTLAGNIGFTSVTNVGVNSGNFAYTSGAIGSVSVLTQTLTTIPGSSYTFSFYQRADSGSPTNSFQAFFGGTSVFSETNAVHGYLLRTFTVVAATAATEIRFEARNDPSFSFLDDISAVEISYFQIRYASNLTSGDSVINLTNTGANGASLNGPGFGGAVGNICVNVYAFSPDEQLVSCCSCLITPNGLASLSVNSDLISNTLTGVRPNSVVVKLVSTGAGANFAGGNCTNSAALAGSATFPLANGMLAFGTTVHAAPVAGTFATTETPFLRGSLSAAELASITNRCTNIIGNGSTFGICRSCRVGGLSGTN